MARPPAQEPDSLHKAIQAVREATDVDSLRQAQAALLPLLGLDLEKTAQAVGKDRYWVSRARGRFQRGDPPAASHGGRRRALLQEDEEVELVRRLMIKRLSTPKPWTPTVRHMVRQHLDDRSLKPVSESTVTALMTRVGRKLFPGVRLSVTEIEAKARDIAWMWQTQDWLSRVAERDKPMRGK